jgi:hypothetical protein
MILLLDDIPVLPKEVEIRRNEVADNSVRQSYPINETGAAMLSLADGKRTLQDIAAEIAGRYQVDRKRVEQDVIVFFEKMHREFLVNIRRAGRRRRLGLALFYMRTLQLRSLFELAESRRRYEIPSFVRMPILLFLYLSFFIPYHYLGLLLGMLGVMVLIDFSQLWAGIVLIVHLFISVAVHECAHIAGLYLVGEKDKFFFIGRKNFTVGIYRQTLSPVKELAVSLMGPLVPALIGLEILYFGYRLMDLDWLYWGLIWVSHLLSLLSTDGRNILHAVLRLLNGSAERKPERLEG